MNSNKEIHAIQYTIFLKLPGLTLKLSFTLNVFRMCVTCGKPAVIVQRKYRAVSHVVGLYSASVH